MKEKNYYNKWLLPKLNLQSTVPGLECYWESPTGNNPELMPLDSSLNEDIHQCVQRHCALTTNFKDNDDRKFSMTTPNRGMSAYLRLWDADLGGSCPSSKRIIKDVNKCF
jgi:hypothetical protein